MQWDAAEQAGFTTGTPWFPVNPNRSWLNAAAQVDDPTSVFAHYRDLIRLRHEHAIFADGDFAACSRTTRTCGRTRARPTRSGCS